MRLGIVARASNTGLGVQTFEMVEHLKPAKTLVVDCTMQRPVSVHLDRFPGATIVNRFPTDVDYCDWLLELDAVLTCETAYNQRMYLHARNMGVRTVLQLNFELFDWAADRNHLLPKPDVFAAPSLWRYEEIPDPKVFLPVPIATERFTVNDNPEARRFLHIVGRPAVHDRNGTRDLLQALRYITEEITVTIKCQDAAYVADMLCNVTVPGNIDLVVDTADVRDYWDLYTGHDVLVMPRRFGGLCLPVNEALGAGMPVVMPNISPNNKWLPSDWLVEAEQTDRFMAKTLVDVYSSSLTGLARIMKRFVNDNQFFTHAKREAGTLAKGLSWDVLRFDYERVLNMCEVAT